MINDDNIRFRKLMHKFLENIDLAIVVVILWVWMTYFLNTQVEWWKFNSFRSKINTSPMQIKTDDFLPMEHIAEDERLDGKNMRVLLIGKGSGARMRFNYYSYPVMVENIYPNEAYMAEEYDAIVLLDRTLTRGKFLKI